MPRLRFSLKALLAALTVGCLLLGWQVEKRRRMVRVVEQIQAGPNWVNCFLLEPHHLPYDPNAMLERFWDPMMLPSIVGADAPDENTVHLVSRLTTIHRLTLVSPEPCDEWLRHLESLENLRELLLDCPKMTDRALRHLAKLKRLETFDTTCTGFSRPAIEQFRRALPNCQIAIYGGSKAASADYPPLNGRSVDPRAAYPEMYSGPTPP